MAQTLTGRQLRWYFNGSAIGLGRAQQLKPDISQGLDPVKECGDPTVIEYVKKVPETSLSFSYAVISKGQLAAALGQGFGPAASSTTKGSVPTLPDNIDVVERRIQPGTEGTTSEVYTGYTLYQGVMVEKDSYDQEVDKIVMRSISAKCLTPLDFEGINGIQFDRFTGNGVLASYTLTKFSQGLSTGQLTIRAETPYQTRLKEGFDYTTASTSSTTSIVFNITPASSSVPNILVVYPW